MVLGTNKSITGSLYLLKIILNITQKNVFKELSNKHGFLIPAVMFLVSFRELQISDCSMEKSQRKRILGVGKYLKRQ